MDKRAVWSTFRAKSGMESEVEAFLDECQKGIEGEPGTSVFYVLRIGPGQYATFDTFQDDAAFRLVCMAPRHGPWWIGHPICSSNSCHCAGRADCCKAENLIPVGPDNAPPR